MTSKSKKDKIKQGNLRDFDLLYDTLVNGGTYSDYRSELLDRSMPQELLDFDISEDDILAAWILGKDEESELYARGGHLAQFGPDSNWYAKGQFDSSKGAFQGAGNSIMSGLSIALTAAGWLGGSYDLATRPKEASERIQANIDLLSSYQPVYGGDNALRMYDYNSILHFTPTNLQDNGAMTKSEAWINGGKSALEGAMTGLLVGGPWGALIGAVGGAAKGVTDYVVNKNNAEDAMIANNLKGLIAEDLNLIKYGYATTVGDKMNLYNQLSQPYMAACGGKMKNKLASGGYINSHYDYITDPLVRVEAGGTHQENPNEGVLTSMAPDGKPNLVEQGETIIDNGQEDAYVFSDRIVADDEILKSHLLPNKFAGKTYADISKELDKIIAEHKNDEISKRTFDEMISRLQQAQEDQKFQEKQEEVEKFLGGLTDEQKEQLEQTMVEEAQAEQQAAEEQAVAEQQAQEQAAAEQGMPELAPEQAPEQVVMEQPEELIVPSRYDQMMSRALFADAADLGMFQLGGHLNLKSGYMPFYNPNLGTASYKGVPYIDPLFASDIAPYTENYYNKTPIEEIVVKRPTYVKPRQTSKTTTVVTTPNVKVEQTPEYSNPHIPNYKIFGEYVPGLKPYEVDGNLLGYTDPFGKFVPIGGEKNWDLSTGVTTTKNNTNTETKSTVIEEPEKNNNTGSTTDYSTWLRYAPAIGSGIQYLSDLFGVTNRNDYTNPNLLQRSINLIPNVGFTPLGGYRTFNPFDETYQQNALRSMNEAARRAVINNANGNYGAALTALNALNYNTSGLFGDLALKAREYNEKERQVIDEYNLKINQINASLSMTAQEKNLAIAALKARLTAALAEMRQQIEDTNDAAKSANMTNFYQNLGNVGKENFNMTMVRSNPAFYYTITGDGRILYKNGFDGLNERDQAFVRSVAEPQAEEQRKKHLEEANKKADETMNPDRTNWSPMMYSYLGRPNLFGYRSLTNNGRN